MSQKLWNIFTLINFIIKNVNLKRNFKRRKILFLVGKISNALEKLVNLIKDNVQAFLSAFERCKFVLR